MKDETFVIRVYSKSELAMLYRSDLTKEAALNWFRENLRVNPRLRHLVDKSIHNLNPSQVKMIVHEMGKPFEIV